MVDTSIVVPEFVLGELQALADSSDSNKRVIVDAAASSHCKRYGSFEGAMWCWNPMTHLDMGPMKLVALSERLQGRLLTLDSNLRAIAKVRGLATVDLEQASLALRPLGNPRSSSSCVWRKLENNPGKRSGRLPDGTMVVVEHADAHIAGCDLRKQQTPCGPMRELWCLLG